MSAAGLSNVQYRLTEVDGGTVIAFRHTAFGFIPDNVREGLSRGWVALHRARADACGDRSGNLALTERGATPCRRLKRLLQELEQEAQTTRRVLERVPADRLGWKPHDKSMSLGQLALHVATVPGAIAELAGQSPFQLPGFNQPSPASAAEIMPALRAEHREGPQRPAADGRRGDWARPGRRSTATSEVMAIPVGALLRTIMLNHWYHHRGQLSVYLRQVGAQVPSIYGPSADENPFMA